MRELSTDLEILDRLAAPAGKDVLDIGCGSGILVRELASRGARMTGVEISDSQLAAALAADPGTGSRYLVGRGQELPLADASVDLALFMRSLHHVPVADQLAALAEARRVLRPGGAIYVAEPLAEGDYFELMRLIEDELEVRRAAQAAIARAAEVGLERSRTEEYEVAVRLTGLEALRARAVAVDPARAETFETHREELGELLSRLGEPGEAPGERQFRLPMRADLLSAG